MPEGNRSADAAPHWLLVWDLPTRIFHWSLVGLLVFLWWTGETDRMQWHKLAGFAVIGLLVFRLIWGFFGHETARFLQFLRGPSSLWRYLRGRFAPYVGHNPLGGWSVIALLGMTAAEAVLGLFSIDDDGLEPGPLSARIDVDTAEQITHWHGVLFDALLVFVSLHIAAVVIYLFRRRNLITPMINGWMRAEPDASTPRSGSVLAFVLGVTLGCAAFAWLYWLDRS